MLSSGPSRRSESPYRQTGRAHRDGLRIYITRLSDVEPSILEQIIRTSYEFIEAKAQDGPIREILWKAEPGGAR